MKTIIYCIIILFIFSCQKKQDSNVSITPLPTKEISLYTIEKYEKTESHTEGMNIPITYFINDLSKQYSTIIKKDTVIQLISKNKNFEQTFISRELQLDKDSSLILGKDSLELFKENSSFIFDDFNFDGSEDIAIRNGNYGSYANPSYDIYLYNITKEKFVHNKELSQLYNWNIDVKFNQKKKITTTIQQRGCCWHSTKNYIFIPQKGLQLVGEVIDDAQKGDSVTTTTKTLVEGKWITEVTKSTLEK